MTKSYTRRTTEQIVADLQARIDAVQARAARRQARANPAIRHGTTAIKAIDKAARETSDGAARKALEDARGALSALLALEGLSVPTTPTEAATTPVKRGRQKVVATA